MTDSPRDREPNDPRHRAWNDSVESILEGGEYDSDLGARMGRDAVRVSMGELTEAEFYERYHQELLDEFGVDNRPVKRTEDHNE